VTEETTDCGAPNAGLRIDQDGRFLKGDFRGAVVANGASWTADTLGLSMLGFGRSRCEDVERERGHVVYKRTLLAPTMLDNLYDKLTLSEESIARSVTGDITRDTTDRTRERLSITTVAHRHYLPTCLALLDFDLESVGARRDEGPLSLT
jgi:hypothetical protein